jgi:hypothetical protein
VWIFVGDWFFAGLADFVYDSASKPKQKKRSSSTSHGFEFRAINNSASRSLANLVDDQVHLHDLCR